MGILHLGREGAEIRLTVSIYLVNKKPGRSFEEGYRRSVRGLGKKRKYGIFF